MNFKGVIKVLSMVFNRQNTLSAKRVSEEQKIHEERDAHLRRMGVHVGGKRWSLDP